MADNWIPETRNRLAQRRAKKPDTKSGQIWALWPEIKAALADGQSFRSVSEWLTEDAGIAFSIPGLRSYVSRSRRKEAVLRKAEAENAFLQAAISGEPQASSGGERAISKSSTGARTNSSTIRGVNSYGYSGQKREYGPKFNGNTSDTFDAALTAGGNRLGGTAP